MVPVCFSKVEGENKRGAHQHLILWRVFTSCPGPSNWHFKISKWISFTWWLVCYNLECISLHASPLKLFLRSLQPLVPVDVSSTGFQSWTFQGLVYQVQVSEAGVSVLVTNRLFLRKKLQVSEFHPGNIQAALLGLRPWWSWISASPTCLSVVLFLCAHVKKPFSYLSVSLKGNVPHAAIDVVCSWEKVSSGSSCVTTLDTVSSAN